MIDFTKPVQTKDGRKVRILATDIKNTPQHFQEDYCVVGAIDNDGYETVIKFTLEGKCFSQYVKDDLVQSPSYVWVNIYKDGLMSVHEQYNQAVEESFDLFSRSLEPLIARRKVPFIEGQFD